MGAVGNDKLARRRLLPRGRAGRPPSLLKAVVRHERDAKADTRQVDQKIVAARKGSISGTRSRLEPLKLAVQELTRRTLAVEASESGTAAALLSEPACFQFRVIFAVCDMEISWNKMNRNRLKTAGKMRSLDKWSR